MGSYALYNLTTGNYNLGLGYKAGENLTSGSGNIIIGYDIDAPSATASNQLNIGNLIFGTNLDGRNATLSSGNVGIGTTSPGYTLDVNGTFNASATSTFAGNVGIGTVSPTNLLSLGGNSARIFWMERHTTANTAGNTLTIQSGSATVGATDKDGGMLTLSPGASTGTGKASTRTQRLGRASSTATADNTLYDAEIIPSVLNLTDASATNLFEVALATLAMAGGTIEYTINVSDGTDMQTLSGIVAYSAVNKGGVYTTQITENASNRAVANSSGTLTASWSVLEGTNKITIQLTADSSLTPTSMKLYYKLHNGSANAITQL